MNKLIGVLLALFVLTPSICFGSPIYDPNAVVVSNDDLLIRYTITKIAIADDGYIATICIKNKDEKKGLLFLERADYDRRRISLIQVNGSAGYPAECSFDTPSSTR